MIIVRIFWNTEADGTWADSMSRDYDDIPQSWFGPFKTRRRADRWAETACEDDKDVFDVVVDYDFTLPEGATINDPEEYPRGYKEVAISG